jgi:hypothetical protein
MNLVFIPVWLEKVLKANNESLAFVLEPENLSRILSVRDLDLYTKSQQYIYEILPKCIKQTFEPSSIDAPGSELDAEQKVGYLYGFLPDSEVLNASPRFAITHLGNDDLVLTVVPGDQAPDSEFIYLMDAMLEILSSVRPFEEVAKTPIMLAWLKATAMKQHTAM